MKILILNVGSATIKYAVFENHKLLFEGIEERVKDFESGLKNITSILKKKNIEIKVIAHRVVHGGAIKESKIINKDLIKNLKKLEELAPLHQTPEIKVIELCGKFFPKTKQMAVFDTAFHSTMPQKAFLYGIPYSFYKKGIKRYGFHGISCEYITKKAQKILNNRAKKMIICHLGNGCSITAVKDGKSIGNSMGFTPLEGVVMGTRCGSIDPSIVLYLMKHEKLTINQISELLNKKSGLLGISGIGNDVRDLIKSKSLRAKLALDVFCYHIIKAIGAYIASLNGADAIIFTGGIGENAWYLRSEILKNFSYLGLEIDDEKNKKNSLIISSPESKVKVLVMHTDEKEVMIDNVLRK